MAVFCTRVWRAVFSVLVLAAHAWTPFQHQNKSHYEGTPRYPRWGLCWLGASLCLNAACSILDVLFYTDEARVPWMFQEFMAGFQSE